MSNDSAKAKTDHAAAGPKAPTHDHAAKPHDAAAAAAPAKAGHTAAECHTKGCTATHLADKSPPAPQGAATKGDAKAPPATAAAAPPHKSI